MLHSLQTLVKAGFPLNLLIIFNAVLSIAYCLKNAIAYVNIDIEVKVIFV